MALKFSISSKREFNFLPQYFINISEKQELILKPIITQRIGSVGWLYYGSRFENGEFNIDTTSITGTKSVKDTRQTVWIKKKPIKFSNPDREDIFFLTLDMKLMKFGDVLHQ